MYEHGVKSIPARCAEMLLLQMGSGRHHGAAVLLGADLLVGDDRRHQHQADHVGERAGDHHAQAADGQDDTQRPVDLLIQMAVQGRRDGKDAQQSADADLATSHQPEMFSNSSAGL